MPFNKQDEQNVRNGRNMRKDLDDKNKVMKVA